MRILMDALGNPQNDLKFIHVAGSNGKGSTCSILESILKESGLSVGLYISPYIEDLSESFQVNGRKIPPHQFTSITEKVKKIADKMEEHPSQFEIKTAIAFLFFKEEKCDIVVLETGLGGEFDSTNIIPNCLVAVFTCISLEHTRLLGNTIREIAGTKAGIIKEGCRVVSYDNPKEAVEEIEKKCKKKNALLYLAKDTVLSLKSRDLDGQIISYQNRDLLYPLLGCHQLFNLQTALRTIDALRDIGYTITLKDIENGLKKVRFPARFEIVRREPLFIIDGGHNPGGSKALSRTLQDYCPKRKFIILFAVMADKDFKGIIDYLIPFASEFIIAMPNTKRAADGETVREYISEKGIHVSVAESVNAACEKALRENKDVLATGSLYLAGEVRGIYRHYSDRDK